jgi:DNA-binding LytR/AlgR family response regulator
MAAGATPLLGQPLRALVVDDEEPTLSELARLLGQDPRVGRVRTAASRAEALLVLDAEPVDVVFCDLRTPGPGGLDLARILAGCRQRPQVVLVTADDGLAVEAADLHATDHVTRPVRPQRLAEAVRRVLATAAGDEVIAVELGGVTRFVHRSAVRYVEAHGDYARLHTATGSHLVRIPLTTLAQRWAEAGFVRIHRSTLVALPHVDEVQLDGGRCLVRLGERTLRVSRRHTRALRERLIRSVGLTGAAATDPPIGP